MTGGGARVGDEARAAVERVRRQSPDFSPIRLAERALLEAHCGDTRRATEYIGRALDLVPDHDLEPDIVGGLLQVGWTAAHLRTRCNGIYADAWLADLDAVAEALAARPNGYDLISGLVGIGVYALERGAAANGLVRLIVKALGHTVVHDRNGIRWEATRGDGVNLGMAHGVAGVVAFLAQATAFESLAVDLLRPAAAWLIHRRRRPAISYAPGKREARNAPQRCGWCNGDLGIATALLQAGAVLGDPAITDFAYELARSAASWEESDGFAEDASLCHGTAGAAHMFAAIAMSAPEPDGELCAAAIRWYDAVIHPPRADRRHRFLTRRFGNGAPAWVSSGAFLDGDVGTALALRAATEPDDPGWDALLLCRRRPGVAG